MRRTHGRFIANAVLLLLAVCFAGKPAFATTDVYKFSLQGFKLGMTLDEVLERYPQMKVVEVKPDKKTIIGYSSRVSEIRLMFSSARLGKKLFHIQLIRVYREKVEPKQLFNMYVEKYGKPDFIGRRQFHVQACWGKCYGDRPRLEFKLKITNMRVGAGFPFTLTLKDPNIERENRNIYLKLVKNEK